MNKIYAIVVIAISVLLALVFYGGEKGRLGGVADINGISTCTSATSSVVSTTKNTLVSTNYDNRYILIQNQDTIYPIFIHFGNATATIADYKLSKGETFVIDNSNLFKGVITAHSTGTAVVTHTTICQ